MDQVKVLVVDDYDAIRKMIKLSLETDAWVAEVREASHGAEALDVCRSWQPDVVVMDYWMPVMDGGSAASLLKELAPEIRIVAFSGVLRDKPEWADALFRKCDLLELAQLKSLLRS